MERICYPSMRHEEGDEEVSVKDCILLASGNRKKDLPYIAKVMAPAAGNFTIVPVMVGSLSPNSEAKYGKIFAKYLKVNMSIK